jgi:hypothetical protein
MSFLSLFNLGRRYVPPPAEGRTEIVQIQSALKRVLSFTGHTIDDVVNDPVAKARVLGFYKLHRWTHREMDISNLERQWNPLK